MKRPGFDGLDSPYVYAALFLASLTVGVVAGFSGGVEDTAGQPSTGLAAVTDAPGNVVKSGYAAFYRSLTGSKAYPEHSEEMPQMYSSSPGKLEKIFNENVSALALEPGWPLTKIETNRYGLRDEGFSRTPPPNTTRILVVGDSYTFGSGVNESYRFTEILERQLNERRPWNYQVINAGVPGWGMKDYYLFLKHRGIDYNPDIVVVTVIGNDWMSFEQYRGFQEDARSLFNRSNMSTGQFYSRSSERFRRIVSVNRNRGGYSTINNISALLHEEDVEVVYFLAGRFTDRERDYITGLISKNDHQQVNVAEEFRDDWQSDFCLKYNFNTLSTLDPHPSPEGHRLMAESLLPVFLDENPHKLPWEPQGMIQWIDPC